MSLNLSFRAVRLSALPAPKGGNVLEISSSCSILDAAKQMEQRDVLSAPVFDEEAPTDCSWSEKYLGIIDHIDLVWWMLDLIHSFGLPPNHHQHQQTILASFASTTVKDLMATKSLGLFIPLDPEAHTLLDALLLLGRYGIRRIPVISASTNKIQNIITQSAVAKLLSDMFISDKTFSEHAGKTLRGLGLGTEQPQQPLVCVYETDTLMHAMQQIGANDVSVVPILSRDGALVGCASSHMVRHFFTTPSNMDALVQPLVKSPKLTKQYITTGPDATLTEFLKILSSAQQHRAVVAEKKRPIRVASLRDVLACVLTEPPASYFRPFFASMTLMRLQRSLATFAVAKSPLNTVPSSSARMLVVRGDTLLMEAAAILLRDRDPTTDTLAAIVDGEGKLLSVLTPAEAQRIVSGRRAITGAGTASTLPLDRGLVCGEADTLAMLVTRLRHTRAAGMVVVDEENRPQRVVMDSDIVLMFASQPAWHEHFAARIWNDWLPAHTHTPPPDETAGRRRSVSWSMPQRSRAGSCGPTPSSPVEAGAVSPRSRRDASETSISAAQSPPKHESPLRSLAARIRNTLSASY
eukprot:m.73290 g.73290  ORF g.73290 m.73290 type:complete len:579 (+) comp13030_c0_seq1:903-2639(+)